MSASTIESVETGDHQTSARIRRALQIALEIPGDPDETREEWDQQVKDILDIIGAYLEQLPEGERLPWLARAMRPKD